MWQQQNKEKTLAAKILQRTRQREQNQEEFNEKLD